MRWHRIGPLSKWVNDHAFVCILRKFLPAFNACRAALHIQAIDAGGQHHRGGRIWWEGPAMPDGCIPEFCKDFSFAIKDLLGT